MQISRLVGGPGLARLAAVLAVATMGVLAARAAWADPPDPAIRTISLDRAGLPGGEASPDTTSSATCSAAATAPVGRDVWIFAVSPAGTGQLVSVTASFQDPDAASGADSSPGTAGTTGEPDTGPGAVAGTGPGSAAADTGSSGAVAGTGEAGFPATGTTPATTPGPGDTPAAAPADQAGGNQAGATQTAGDQATDGQAAAGHVTVTAEAGSATDTGALTPGGAWVISPAGWQLTAATARVTGDAGELELVAVCPGSAGQAGAGLLMQPSAGPTPAGNPEPAPMASLPVAGTDVVPLVSVGTGLVLAGALLIVARGRKPKQLPDRDEDDIRRPVLVVWRD